MILAVDGVSRSYAGVHGAEMTCRFLRGDAAIVGVLKLRRGRGKLIRGVVRAAAAMSLLAPGRLFVAAEIGQS